MRPATEQALALLPPGPWWRVGFTLFDRNNNPFLTHPQVSHDGFRPTDQTQRDDARAERDQLKVELAAERDEVELKTAAIRGMDDSMERLAKERDRLREALRKLLSFESRVPNCDCEFCAAMDKATAMVEKAQRSRCMASHCSLSSGKGSHQ